MKNTVLKIEKLYLLKKIRSNLNYIKNYNLDKYNDFYKLTNKLKDKELLKITDNLVFILKRFINFDNINSRKILIIYLLKNFTDKLIEKQNIVDKHMLYWCDELLKIINNPSNINIQNIIIFEKYFNVVNQWLIMDKNRLMEKTLFSLKDNKDLIEKLKTSNIEEKDILLYNAIHYQNILLDNIQSLNKSLNIKQNILDNIDNIINDYNNQYKYITSSIKYNYLLVFVKKLKEEIKKDNREIIYLNLLEINSKIKNKEMIIDENSLKEIVLDDKLLLEYLKNISNIYKLNIVFDKPENYIPEIIIKINHFL
jgi:hypothetical protein